MRFVNIGAIVYVLRIDCVLCLIRLEEVCQPERASSVSAVDEKFSKCSSALECALVIELEAVSIKTAITSVRWFLGKKVETKATSNLRK